MAKFKLTWPDGTTEVVEQSDCKTVEQYINCRFGSQGTGETTVELDAHVTKTGQEYECETKVTVKPKK